MKHTPNGPSQLSKRARCPASFWVEDGLEDEFDEDADSGTTCHQAMENWLRGLPEPNLTDAESAKVKFAKDSLEYLLMGDEIIPGSGRTKADGIVMVELTMDNLPYSIDGSPECGTVDLAIIYPDHVLMMDWKFGGSFVDAPKWNLQLKGLSTGIWEMYSGREIHAAIVQPRAGKDHRVEPWVFSPSERSGMVSDLHQILVDCHEKPDTYCVGKACQFCKGARRNTCPARIQAMGVFSKPWDPATMDATERARYLAAAKAAISSAEKFIEGCKTYVMETGEAPQGWRASPTKTSVRLDPTPSAPSWPADHKRLSMRTIEF